MTRKDYVMIADTLRGLLADIERESAPMAVCDRTRACLAGERLGVRNATLRMADVLANDNPRFDRHQFLQACSLNA
jgi:hypothetical protein